MCRMQRCCCGCCGLRGGCIAVAVTMLVLNGLAACLLGLSLQSVDATREKILAEPELYFDGRTPTEQEIEDLMYASVTLARVSMAVVCINLICDLVLLAAALLRRRPLLLPWLIWYCISCLAMLSIGIYILWVVVESGKSTLDIVSYIVGAFVAAGLYVCLMVVVLSYYRELKDGPEGRGSYELQPQRA